MKKIYALIVLFIVMANFIPAVSAVEAVSAKAISSDYESEVFIKDDKAYFFMPTNCDIKNVSIVTFAENGDEISRKTSIDFSKENDVFIELHEKKYTVVVMKSELPSLIFDINEEYGKINDMNTSEEHTAYCYGDVSLVVSSQNATEKGWEGFVSQENDENSPGTVKIRGRGNTTWDWYNPNSKKPYQFKLEKKTDILGMGKSKTWVLLKNDADIIKNKLGLDLGLRMGIEYSSNSEFVDVFMNGEYLGNYLLAEKVEIGESRVNISNLDNEFKNNNNSIEGLDLTGGYLVEIDGWGDGELRVFYKLPENMHTWCVIKEPENLATKITNDNAYSYISNLMKNLLDAVYTDGKMPDGKSYLEYIDVDSFIRYFYHQEFLKNFDSGRSSTYFYKDKDSIDGLIHAGPVWDHDRIFESGGATGWALRTICIPGSEVETFYNKMGRRLDFATLLVEAYETTDIPEVLNKAPELVDEYVKDIGVSGEMNSIRWNLKKFNPYWIKECMTKRAAWIDENYTSLLSVARDDGITVLLDNKPVIFDVKPIIKDERTLVPVRAIFEALGAEVFWEADTRTVIAKKENITIKIQIDSNEMYVNSEIRILDVPASIMDGRTLIPLRAVSEAFECSVSWDGETQTVFIDS